MQREEIVNTYVKKWYEHDIALGVHRDMGHYKCLADQAYRHCWCHFLFDDSKESIVKDVCQDSVIDDEFADLIVSGIIGEIARECAKYETSK